MMTGMLRFLLMLLCTLRLAGADQSVRVSCAVSLKEAMSEIASQFQAEHGAQVQFNFGASGQLARQIESGAPCDLLISAAVEQVQQLERQGLCKNGSSFVVTTNRLVLIVPGDSKAELSGFDSLAGIDGKIAIGDPKTVPAGQYAAEVLRKKGLETKLAGQLVYGANVRQVLDYVIRGEVAAGVVYSTDAGSAGDKVRVVAVADPAWHSPIVYPCVVLKGADERAGAFVAFLQGDRAKSILSRHGFGSAVDAPSTNPSTPK